MYIEQLRPARKIFFKGDLGHPTVQYMILFTLCTLLYCMAVCTVHDLVYLNCVRYCTAWQYVLYMIFFTLCTVLYYMAVCTVHDRVYLKYSIVLHGSLYCTWSYLPCVRYCSAWQFVQYMILFTLCTVLYCMAVCTSSMEKSGSKITDSSPASSIKI